MDMNMWEREGRKMESEEVEKKVVEIDREGRIKYRRQMFKYYIYMTRITWIAWIHESGLNRDLARPHYQLSFIRRHTNRAFPGVRICKI